MLIDISLRDADKVETLTALFATAKGKYDMVLEPGVVGSITRLQLAATPFEQVLDAILGNEYSYQKQYRQDGSYLFKISGPRARNVATATMTDPSAMMAPPDESVAFEQPLDKTASGNSSTKPAPQSNTSKFLSILSHDGVKIIIR